MAAEVSQKAILKFAWQGASHWSQSTSVRQVELVFQNATTTVNVTIPPHFSPRNPRLLRFNFKKITGEETHPNKLHVKLEQIRTITIKAHVVTRSPEGVENTEIWHLYLNEYEEVVPEATYNLIVSSQKYLLSVDLVRNPERTPHAEWRRRLETMIQALREEAVRNFVLAQRGGIPIPDSTSPKAEMMAHGLRSVLRAGQHVLPELQDLDARPTETIADLDRLSVEELQARLDATFIQSKKYEAQHLQLAQNKNIAMLNHHLSLEIANTQLLINLEEALKRKGVIAKPPESEEAKSAIAASEEAHTAMLQQFAEACNTQ